MKGRRSITLRDVDIRALVLRAFVAMHETRDRSPILILGRRDQRQIVMCRIRRAWQHDREHAQHPHDEGGELVIDSRGH